MAWSVQFHPFDYYFCTGNADRSVAVYTTDRIHPVRLMTGHGSDVNVVQWHDNGILLASGSDDRSVRLWDLRTAENARILRGCNSPVSSLAISSIGMLIQLFLVILLIIVYIC